MRQLTQTEFFGKDLAHWQIKFSDLQKIKSELDPLYYITEENIEAVCIILNKLGYIEFKGENLKSCSK